MDCCQISGHLLVRLKPDWGLEEVDGRILVPSGLLRCLSLAVLQDSGDSEISSFS